MKSRTAVFALAILIGVAPTAAAQDTPEIGSGNLAEMLRFVPDNENARLALSYGDYQAGEAARQLEVVPENIADFEAMPVDAQELWIMSFPPGGINRSSFNAFGDMHNVMGMDFFQIDQALAFGALVDEGYILRGNFDTDAIRAAHEARGFVESELSGIPVLCSADGCDAEYPSNVDRLELNDIFGGRFGWKLPRAVIGSMLISAISHKTLEQMLAAGASGGVASLMDDSAYQAAVAALDGDHYLRTAQFAPPEHFYELGFTRISADNLSDERIRNMWIELRGGEVDIPAYELVVFADIAQEGSESAIVGLVYPDEESANSAGLILTERIAAAHSMTANELWRDIFAARGATVEPAHVFHDEATGHFVTLITLTKPMSPDEQIDGRYVQSGLLFRLLLSGYVRRDLGWLQPVILN